MHGHAVTNPIKVGRVLTLRGNRGLPVVVSALDGTWVEVLDNKGQHRRIEVTLAGRAVILPGYAATGIDLGGAVATAGTRHTAVRGLHRGPSRSDHAAAQHDLRTLLLHALLSLVAQQQAAGAHPDTSPAGTITRQEAAAWASMRVQGIDHHRERGAFVWRTEGGRVVIDAGSFETWLVARRQREQEREAEEHG